MIEHKKIIKFTEIFLIIFVWLVLLITPIFFKEENNNPILGSVLKQLEILIPLSLLFLINRLILVPGILFRGKQFTYIISVIVIIGMLVVGLYFYHNNFGEGPSPFRQPSNISQRSSDNPPRPENDQPDNQQKPGRKVPKPVPPYANFLILSFLIVGFDTGLRATLRWTEVEQEKVQLEKEFVATQLVVLRNQVSPHFFMNTLNNIHSLVDINTEEAKEAIIKLSKMMRYLLYETETEKTTLKKEIEFLESYVNLMKLRFNEKVTITLNFPTIIPDKNLPPFLFTSIIENAFKHGISYKNESFINIDLIIGNERLLFVVKNSKADNKQIDDYSGIGIENTKKRLELLYGKSYHLDIIDSEELFTVNLSIPL
jgi:hypothetical protein